MEKYYLGLSLSRWAMIQYCYHLWKQPEFRDHTIQDSRRNNVDFMIISTKLREHLSNLILPLPIKNELIIAVGTLGHRVKSWFQEVRWKIPDITFDDCIDHIHWSCNGTIDCTQSAESLYKAKLLPMAFGNWELLCEYCVEECLLDFWTKISTNNEHNDVLQTISDGRHCNVFCHYWKFRITGESHDLLKLKECLDYTDDSKTVEENMLKFMPYADYAPFRYFWNRLDESKKQSICCLIDTPGSHFYGFALDVHDFDIFIFILQQLMIRGSKEMLNKMMILPSMVPGINTWPCSNISLSALHDFYNHENFERRQITWMLLNRMHFQRTYIFDDSETRKQFYNFWDVHHHGDFEPFICHMIEFEDIESLKYVIMRAKTREEKKTIVKMIAKRIVSDSFDRVPFLGERYERLKKFIDEVAQDLIRDRFKENLARRGIMTGNL